MRQNWHTILLANVAFTFVLILIVTSTRRPRYRWYETHTDYFQDHPRQSNPHIYHPYMPLASYSGFSYTQLGYSGNFSLTESLVVQGIPRFTNGSLTGRIDIRTHTSRTESADRGVVQRCCQPILGSGIACDYAW